MADAHRNYHDYLLGRSRLGFLYRKWLLFPVMCRYITGKVLDFGCGIGDFLQYRPATVGVDINEKNIAYCQSHGLSAKLIVDGRIPFKDNFFDLVVMDNVLEHIPAADVDATLNEVVRVLQSEGTVVVGVPGIKGYHSDNDHKVFYDQDDLVALFERHGFVIVKNFYMPLPWFFLERYLSQYCLYAVFRLRY